MEKDKKKKTYNFNGKQKANRVDEEEKKRKTQKVSKPKYPLLERKARILPLLSFHKYKTNLVEYDHLLSIENKEKQEDNYQDIISEKRERIKIIDQNINEEVNSEKQLIELYNEIMENNKKIKEKIISKVNKIIEDKEIQEILKNEYTQIEQMLKECNEKKDIKKKTYEKSLQSKSNDIISLLNDLENEKNKLSKDQNENVQSRNQIPEVINSIQIKEQEINEEKITLQNRTENKNTLKEQFDKANKISINDNKFCHDNFYSSLIFFPYFKNVAFIFKNENNGTKDIIIDDSKNKNEINNIDENRIIIDEEIEDEIEKENINNIKLVLEQKENKNKNVCFKILKDRRTLQISVKEKYKFKKIFSTINNNYIAEPWNSTKYFNLKLSTINSYFNEFNMTAISNNYFIIYFVAKIDKTSLNNELFHIYQKLKNNEYIDKNIIIKISVITESNYINLQNINQESKVKNQLTSITNNGTHQVYGFLYEFTKTNRLNKKNVFRIYNFDYTYPYAIDMMNNISKYYAKKKRKKTGVYKKLNRQGGQKRKQADKSFNNINNMNNKGKGKNINLNNKKNNNLNKLQNKKNISENNIGNLKKNNSNINIPRVNKINNNKNNKKINSVSVSPDENKKVLKKSGSDNTSHKKEISKNLLKTKNSNNNSNSNMKSVKKEEKLIKSRNNSENKNAIINKQKASSMVFNDLKIIKPEHTLVIHDINSDFVSSKEFKQIAKACGVLNNLEK